jgi:hypothetical protein
VPAREPASQRRAVAAALAGPWLAALAVAIAVFWIAGIAGFEGTIVTQRDDFRLFHEPVIRRFAELPLLEAVRDYGAAPFPTFYIVNGWIYAATGSVAMLHAGSLAIAAACVALLAALVRRRYRDQSAFALVALLGFVGASPYFRGQVVWMNTDVLPLLFLAGALWFNARAEQGGRFRDQAAALVLAFLAFYTRQFYLFAPAFLACRYILLDGRHRIAAFALCAVLALPGVGLLALWHGVVPPSFAQHEQRPYPLAALPYTFANLMLYLAPVIAMTLWRRRAALRAVFDARVAAATAVAWIAYLAYFWLTPAAVAFFDIGGGVLAQAVQRLPLGRMSFPLFVALSSLFLPYLVYLVAQDWRRNFVLVLFILCFLPTGIIFQRYFDPVSVVLLFLAMNVAEVDDLLDGRRAFAYPALELAIAAIGFVHYGQVFEIF